MPSVSQETASRGHEEMDWGANGNRAVTGSVKAASLNCLGNKRGNEKRKTRNCTKTNTNDVGGRND